MKTKIVLIVLVLMTLSCQLIDRTPGKEGIPNFPMGSMVGYVVDDCFGCFGHSALENVEKFGEPEFTEIR